MPAPCSSAFCSSSEKTRASAVARLPASETGSSSRLDVAAGADPLHEHRAEAVDQLREVDVLLPLLGERLVHGGDGEDPVDGVLERLARVDALGARLQAQERGDGLEVVLDAVVDLLGEDAAHHRAAVLERDGGVVGDRLEQRPLLVGERRVAVGHELADLAPLPAQRRPDGVGTGARLPATRSGRPPARAPRRSPAPRPSSS